MPNILNNNLEVICYACGKGEFPENILEAIAHCQKVNPSWIIEMDLQLTKDGKVVLFHDDSLFRIAHVDQPISETNYKDLEDIDAAYNFKAELGFPLRGKNLRIPLLESVFRRFPKAKYVLDIHSSNIQIVDKVIYLVERQYLDKQIVLVSKYHHILEQFRIRRPYWVYGASSREVKKLLWAHFFGFAKYLNLKASIVMIPVIYKNRKILTRRLAVLLSKKNKRTWVWLHEGKQVITIDSKNQFERIKNYPLEAVFTSCPEQLNKQVFLKK